MSLGTLKSFFTGFLVMAGLILAVSAFKLFTAGKFGLGFLFLLVAPSFVLAVVLIEKAKHDQTEGKALKTAAMAFQGAAFACWAFDNITTFFAIDIAQIAFEQNPLGWPLGAIGALIYYVPTLIFTGVMLSKIEDRIAVYVAFSISILSLCMGAMNFVAGLGNFNIVITQFSLASNFTGLLLAAIAVDLVTVLCITGAKFTTTQRI